MVVVLCHLYSGDKATPMKGKYLGHAVDSLRPLLLPATPPPPPTTRPLAVRSDAAAEKRLLMAYQYICVGVTSG